MVLLLKKEFYFNQIKKIEKIFYKVEKNKILFILKTMYILPDIINSTHTLFDNISIVDVQLDKVEQTDQNNKVEKTFILKDIPILDQYSQLVQLNAFFTEAMVSYNFNCSLLHHSHYCCIRNNNLQLFSDKADTTCRAVRKTSFKKIHAWISTLILAIIYLHKRRLIHGDIKATNILVFNDDIKLADFGMVTLILENNVQKFPSYVKMYTPTHRAPEVWNGDTWGFPADIWSLGCTFFEIVYGYSLFPAQKDNKAYTNCLNDWNNRISRPFYNQIVFPDKWSKLKNSKINSLIISMLHPDAMSRPTIFEILNTYNNFYIDTSSNNSSFTNTPLSTSPANNSFLNNLNNSFPSNPINQFGSVSQFGSVETITEIVEQPINERYYFIHNIRSNVIKTQLYSSITSLISEKEIIMIDLIASLFESVNTNMTEVDKITVKACATIIHFIVYRTGLFSCIYTQQDISEIIRISEKIRFNYINWVQFYHVIT